MAATDEQRGQPSRDSQSADSQAEPTCTYSPTFESDTRGYQYFPERFKRKDKPASWSETLFNNQLKCENMLQVALKNPIAKVLLEALKEAGCPMVKERHFSCEECTRKVAGGFDSETCQLVLCKNVISNQSLMNRIVNHELIHAYDHCRGQVDWFGSMDHLACSEIRAANLSGECSFFNELSRLNFGFKRHHQACARRHALRSVMAVRQVSWVEVKSSVDRVLQRCLNDLEPFGCIPSTKCRADHAFRTLQNRTRYYANL
uniref:mitochondrial inner membrane protease ATP23 homolog isoform X1 n=1 Tax=Myxine glutinosa TaxID=7769 RepID=UPI00358F2183